VRKFEKMFAGLSAQLSTASGAAWTRTPKAAPSSESMHAGSLAQSSNAASGAEDAGAITLQCAVRGKLAVREAEMRRDVISVLCGPKRTPTRVGRLSVAFEDELEETETPGRGWPCVSISRGDSELTFALHLSVSEMNLQGMIRPSSHAHGLSSPSRLSASVRRVVKLKVGVKGASRTAGKAPPHLRKMVLCLLLFRVLSFAAAAAAAFALAAGYAPGYAARGGLQSTDRASLTSRAATGCR